MKIIKHTYIIFFCISLIFLDELTDEQKQKINEVTEDLYQAPNFTLNTVNDSTVTLNDLRGKVVLLNFWAIWCEPCILEFYDFNSLYDKFNEKGLEILGVNISTNKKELLGFLEKYKDGGGRSIEYPILYGSKTEIDKIMYDYGGVYQIPISFLIDSEGTLHRIYPAALFSSDNPILDPDNINFKRMFGYYSNEMIASITSMHDDLVMNIELLLSNINK